MSNIVVHELAAPTDMLESSALLASIWGTDLSASPLQHDALSGIHHAGGSVLGARHADTLVGVAVTIAGAPCSDELFGMITGVAEAHRGTGVGTALKLAQKAWGLSRGAVAMRWTYDPMLLANATFNVNRLGGVGIEFVQDCYAPIDDAFNGGAAMDRFVVRWAFDPPPTAAQLSPPPTRVAIARGPSGHPIIPTAAAELDDDVASGYAVDVAIPTDIVALRQRDPEGARLWTEAYRTVLPALYDKGFRAVSVTDATYRFEPSSAAGVDNA